MLRLKMKKKGITVYDLFEGMFVIAAILNFQTMWITIKPYARYIDLFCKVLYVLSGSACVFMALRNNAVGKRNRKPIILIFSILLFIYMGFYIVIRPIRIRAYFWFCLCTFISCLYCGYCINIYNNSSFVHKFTKIVGVIATISLLFWVFGSLLHVMRPTGNVISGWTGSEETDGISIATYYGLHFEPQLILFTNVKLARNSSIFTEAPMASFVYSLAFLMELFLKKESNIGRCIILSCAIVSSFSTTGMITMVLAIGFKYLISKPVFSIGRVIKVMIVPVGLIVSGYMAYSMFVEKLGQGSGMIRVDDFQAGFLAWKENLIFGAGFGEEDILKKHMAAWRWYNQGYSNSIFYILAQCGLYLGIVYFFGIVKGISNSINSENKKSMVFIVLFCFMFVVTISCYQYLPIIVILAYVMNKSNRQIIGVY